MWKKAKYVFLSLTNPPYCDKLRYFLHKYSKTSHKINNCWPPVSPGNPVQIIHSCQKAMRNANLLEALCDILMASGVPADILTETINTVGEVIRGDPANQEYFAGVMAPSTPPRPAIVVLLMSMVNEKQPFGLRCAVLYCFQCYLCKYEIGQAQVSDKNKSLFIKWFIELLL